MTGPGAATFGLHVSGVAGATIPGNGAVALIVDVAHLVRRPHP
jgi:chemotaxis protein histidine kinase CheA